MKWAFLVVGVIVGLIALVAIVGSLLPRDHVAAMSARVAATPEAVWAVLVDASSFPTWRRDVKAVDVLPATPTGPSWREHSSNGTITYVVDVVEPPRRMIARIADKKLPFGGSWEYRVESAGATESKVTIIERGSVYNPIFRFVSRFLMGHTATIDAYLRALGRKFGGEAVAPLLEGTGHGL
ncbi:MAG TPA: SRPBCC family protein [Gemmatimonadaceae bacterium]